MDAKSEDDVTEPRPAVRNPEPEAVSRKAARKDANRQPLNPDDPDPAWLGRGNGRRTLIGVVLVLVVVAGIAALGWVWFEPATTISDDDQPLTSDDCQITEHDDEAANVPMPSSLGETAPRATATVATNRGDITVLLFGNPSPCGVSGFEYLTEQGFYKNSQCYRLTTQPTDPTVTLRCGDPTGTGKGGPGYRFQAEDAFTGNVGRDYVALINDNEGMAGGNFAFIRGESKPTASLSVIGQVIAGHEVLDRIGGAAGVEPYDNEPVQPVVIEKITIEPGTVTIPPTGENPSGTPTTGTTSETPTGTGAPSSGGETSGDIEFPN